MTRRTEIAFALVIALLASGALLWERGFAARVATTPASLEAAIRGGVGFLAGEQLPDGEFKTQACGDEAMHDCYFDSTPFTTTFIVPALGDVRDERIGDMEEKAIAFLRSEEEPGGLWRYASSKNPQRSVTLTEEEAGLDSSGLRNPTQFDPDLDVISTVSYVLKSRGIVFGDNAAAFGGNRDPQGRFLTWLRSGPGIANDTDCAVNANVLLYLGNDPQACLYVNASVESSAYRCSPYYPDPLMFYYLVSRAEKNGASCLSGSRNVLVQKVLSLRGKYGSFGNELQNAAALTVLLNSSYRGEAADAAASYLLNSQREDGSWPIGLAWIAPFPYFGSPELTTALSVEALNAYLLSRNR
jgi:hypothetical protein